MPNEPWGQITITCNNYQVGCVGRTARVTINKNRVCTSDCDAVWCPLHQSETHVKKELGAKKDES